jgi:hypothetical protein
MKSMSRREALLASAAALALAPLPAVASGNPDAELLALGVAFDKAYAECNELGELAGAKKTEAENHPDRPNLWAAELGTEEASANAKAYFEFFEAYVGDSFARWNAAGDKMGKLANRIFATPAHTPAGMLLKARILYTNFGDSSDFGDDGLDAYQDEPWFPSLIADLERLAASVS